MNDSLPKHMLLHQRLIEIMQVELQGSRTPGVSAAVYIDGQPVFSAAVGSRDLEGTILLDPSARFYIYSVTKSLTAALIMRLAEQGQVGLDAPVQDYLPRVELPVPVTLRQLLNHTGGIPDYGGMADYHAAVKAHPARPWTSVEFLAATLPSGLTFTPGQGWAYSNVGYLLLKMLIEEVLQTTLQEAFQTRLFDPLGVQGPAVAETLADSQMLTPGWSAFFSPDHELADVRGLYHPGWVSHGVVIASAPDLARLLDGIFGGLLSAASRAAMFAAVDVGVEHPLFKRPGYGLGLMTDSASRYGMLVGHGGGGPGYAAGFHHLPDANGRRITSAALANCDVDDLALRIAHRLALAVADTLPG